MPEKVNAEVVDNDNSNNNGNNKNAVNSNNNGGKKKWYQHTGCNIGCGIVAFILIVLVLMGIHFTHEGINTYNSLNADQQSVKAQQSQVQNVLQERADKLPEMEGAVKGSQKQERAVYGVIAKARTQYYHANQDYKHANSASARAQDLNKQNGVINAMVGTIHERYPKIGSESEMNSLMVEIEGSNNRVAVERRNLNEDVGSYNTKVKNFPTNIIANYFNFHPIQQFKASKASQKAPGIHF